MKMSLEGFLKNHNADYAYVRQKILDVLNGMVEEGMMDEEQCSETMEQLDSVAGNTVFLIDTMKLPVNDPEQAELRGIAKWLEAAAKKVKVCPNGYNRDSIIRSIRSLNPETIMGEE